jgi:pentatricopeptide repeat protein
MCAISAKAYAHQGEPDQVKRILAEMRQNSLETKPQVWGSLVHALVNAGQLDG